jgi:tetratricopeptide (TPR) repeat protein
MKTTGLEESKSYREQIRDEKKAVELAEEERLLHSVDQVDAAVARLQERLKTELDNANIYVRLGDLYVRKERYDFARACYEKAHALNPGYATEEKLGDAACGGPVLPRLRCVAVLHRGDEEFPPEANLLFEDRIANLLPLEDVAVLAGLVATRLSRAAR